MLDWLAENWMICGVEAILLVVAIIYFVVKKPLIGILVIASGALLFITCGSITDEEAFNAKVEAREDAVKHRLGLIAIAENNFKQQNNDVFTANWDSLINFIKYGNQIEIHTEGVLTEYLQQQGWTDESAAKKIYELKQQGLKPGTPEFAAALEACGKCLSQFYIDTIKTPFKEYLAAEAKKANIPFDLNNIDELKIIPYSDGENASPSLKDGRVFELTQAYDSTVAGVKVHIMQCCAPDSVFLKNMGPRGKQRIRDREEDAMTKGTYAGLKIGSDNAQDWNQNGGNWDK